MLKVDNLSKTFELDNGEKVKALDGISFEVEEGEILGIIGRSGSGKTTLLRTLRGVEPVEEGEIQLERLHITPDTTPHYYHELKKITAIHLQRNFGIWPETPYNNVLRKLYANTYGDESMCDFKLAEQLYGDEALKLLKLVGLYDKKDHLGTVLSGGEKQRLIMARELAKKPKLLLLDEPATMACPKTKQETLDAIKNINKELGITIVLVSHLPEIHEYLSDRLIHIENGKIVDEGEVEPVIQNFLKDMEPVNDINIESTDECIINVKDLFKRFFLLTGGDVLNMEDINLEVYKQDILSLIGPSGAGKTILLRMLGGLEVPDKGEILYKLVKEDDSVEWVNIGNASISRLDIRRKSTFMHQEFALTHYSTVREQLATKLGYKNRKLMDKAKSRAKEINLSDELLDAIYLLTDLPANEASDRLMKVGLPHGILDELFPKFPSSDVESEVKEIFEDLNLSMDILDRKSYELSGGQKVRVMLALQLISKPEILLLDEPFGDLDPITLRTVTNSLKTLAKRLKFSVVMVSHNTDFVKEFANRAVFMDDGKLLDDGKPDKLVDDFIKYCHADYLM
ncbi:MULTISPECIES: ATP-binding cassette domain-containing protein [unclassified Methanobrevibacter]|jgi:methyl coenzyme M reductase system subunit A2|uniref:ATP-binding cassette domain-containing protein n=1 Tax=unclassified Methanobrevibacter TaxID=2638681 RepID=UPI00375A1EF4|nr:ATP-binding cassette domain-containing protein [Methanobacteriaceae archaeon]